MDVSRLSVTHLSGPLSASIRAARQSTSADQPEPTEFARPPRAGRKASERVVQGELLYRGPSSYQSTRAFIDERRLEQARPADRPAESLRRPTVAISQYLNNTAPEAAAVLAPAHSVDFFV